jgi:hypothetical protein
LDLKSDLLRIVNYRQLDNGSAEVERLVGTAFLISDEGLFMTAAHVLKQAIANEASHGRFVGIVGKDANGTHVARLSHHEFAPNGQDVAVGLSAYKHKTWYRISGAKYDVWQRVASCGFPEDAISVTDNKIRQPLRAYKGIIQRVIAKDCLALMPKSKGYELSFSPSPGVSGAPLFIYRGEYGEVAGVCVGSFRSEQVEDEITQINDNGERYTEKRVRITQYGLAESLDELFDWKPDFLHGASLAEVTTNILATSGSSKPE